MKKRKSSIDWSGRTEEWYLRRIGYLAGFMTPGREETLRRTVAMRTRYLTICTENTFHPQNASALLRNCEAFGVQDVHTVQEICEFKPNKMIVRGTDQWLDLHRHPTTTDALSDLKRRGYRIAATTPHEGDYTPETFPVTDGPFALVFGTEHAGISREVIAASDAFVRIPMCGFVESLNVSASAAILLQRLTARLRESDTPWQLSAPEQTEILFRWMMSSVRDSVRILARFDEKNNHITERIAGNDPI